MTDEVQTTASAADPAAAPPADAVTSKAADEQAAIRALIEGNVAPAPKPEPTAEEQAAAQAEKDKAEGKLPDWAAERVARAKKQRDESREREAQIEARFGELREVVDALTTKLDPDQYPTHEAYLAAKTEILDRAAKLRGEPAVPPKSAVNEAAEELAYEVQRADHAVFGRAQRQVDHGHGLAFGWGFGFGVTGLADRAGACGPGRVAAVGAAFDDRNRGQQVGQGAHGGGFAGAPVAQDQHATDRGVDRHHLDGEGHFILTNDGRKREGQCHGAFRKTVLGPSSKRHGKVSS